MAKKTRSSVRTTYATLLHGELALTGAFTACVGRVANRPDKASPLVCLSIRNAKGEVMTVRSMTVEELRVAVTAVARESLQSAYSVNATKHRATDFYAVKALLNLACGVTHASVH